MKKNIHFYWGRYIGMTMLLFLIMFSCEPDDLTKPVRVHWELSYIEDDNPESYLSFSKIVLNLKQLSFAGIREEGSDVVFNTRPDQSLGMYMLTPTQNRFYVTYFDLPQGIYKQMRWDVQLGEINEDIYPDDLVDSDDFGFIIEGNYTRTDGRKILLFFAIEEEELIRVESVNQDHELPIPVVTDNEYTVFLEFNPHAIMRGLPRSMLEEAETDEEDDIEFIEISESENEELYNLVLFQMSKALKAVVR